MSAPCAGISPLALIGSPPEHREHRANLRGLHDVFTIGLGPGVDIAPSALIEAFCTVDGGVRSPTTIGERTWLQKRVHVGHDAQIGDDCEICAGVTICGHVTIGDGVRIGGNAWVRPFITIGDGARIGGGAVVVKDVPDGEVWAGNPARKLVKSTVRLRWPVTYLQVPDGRHGTQQQVTYDDDEHDRKYGIDELPPGGC